MTKRDVRNRVLSLALCAGIALSSAACTTATTDSSGKFVITSEDTDTLDVVFVDDEYYSTGVVNGVISYVAHGAGGCPPVIESVTQLEDSIVLVGKDWGDGPCAESYVLVHQKISLANGQQIPEDQKIEVVNPSGYYQ